jgi:hypothetical protein
MFETSLTRQFAECGLLSKKQIAVLNENEKHKKIDAQHVLECWVSVAGVPDDALAFDEQSTSNIGDVANLNVEISPCQDVLKYSSHDNHGVSETSASSILSRKKKSTSGRTAKVVNKGAVERVQADEAVLASHSLSECLKPSQQELPVASENFVETRPSTTDIFLSEVDNRNESFFSELECTKGEVRMPCPENTLELSPCHNSSRFVQRSKSDEDNSEVNFIHESTRSSPNRPSFEHDQENLTKYTAAVQNMISLPQLPESIPAEEIFAQRPKIPGSPKEKQLKRHIRSEKEYSNQHDNITNEHHKLALNSTKEQSVKVEIVNKAVSKISVSPVKETSMPADSSEPDRSSQLRRSERDPSLVMSSKVSQADCDLSPKHSRADREQFKHRTHSFLNRNFYKDFGPDGIFKGVVTGLHCPYIQVRYSDGDKEELEEGEFCSLIDSKKQAMYSNLFILHKR